MEVYKHELHYVIHSILLFILVPMDVNTITALNNSVTVVTFNVHDGGTDIHRFLTGMKSDVLPHLPLHEKCYFALIIEFRNMEKSVETTFRGKISIISNEEEIPDQVNETFTKLAGSVEKFTTLGSGWVVNRIKSLSIHRVKYKPLQNAK